MIKSIQSKNKNFLSSGNLFLDKITGGLSLGTIVLLVEDSPTDIYKTFLKYCIAEGAVNEQKIFFYYKDESLVNDIINNLPYKSTQVESILNAKKVSTGGDTSNLDSKNEMKIAWRYENIKYSNLLEDLVKSTEYIFDISRQLQDTYLTNKNKNIISSTSLTSESIVEILDEFNKKITKDYQNYTSQFTEEETKYVRVVLPNLFTNFYLNDQDYSKIESEVKIKLTVLKNLARSINGITFLTIDKESVNSRLFKLVYYFSDYVFTLKSFLLEPQRLEDYDALFYVNKIPRICSFKTVKELETDTYGIIVEKRKLIIEKIDIGAEVDRNTKVKEKDIPTSQAICGGEKYSKNYEF